ncbi:MAG: DEAD/DEAH box helicase [bacterium]
MNWLAELEQDELRYYQQNAVEAIQTHLSQYRSCLLVMATGLGKTQVFCDVARNWPGRILILAHRKELVIQARDRLEQMSGEYVGIEQAQQKPGEARLVVASIDTIKLKNRLEKYPKDYFSLIIVDECHHYLAKTYKRPLEHFNNAKVVGVTATPQRGDGKALSKIFDKVCYTMGILEGIDSGYLVPLKGKRVFLDEIDLSLVPSKAGDLDVGKLDEAMFKAVEGIVKGTMERAGDRKGICFFPGVRSAQFACDRFNALKPGSACFISGKTGDIERTQLVDDFKEGKYQYLCNCAIATEGFDSPDVSLIVIGRPTKSPSLYTQMVGRGTRVLPYTVDHIKGKDGWRERQKAISSSVKEHCLLLDFVGNSGRHELMTPVDILAGNYTEDEVKRAKKLEKIDENDGKDPREILEMARLELKMLAEAINSRMKSWDKDFNPFAVFHVKPDDNYTYGDKAASDKMKDYLVKQGMERKFVNSLSASEAKKLQNNIWVRQQRGLAGFRQLRILKKYGVSKINISRARANAAITYIEDSGWRPDQRKLNAIVFDRRMAGEDG